MDAALEPQLFIRLSLWNMHRTLLSGTLTLSMQYILKPCESHTNEAFPLHFYNHFSTKSQLYISGFCIPYKTWNFCGPLQPLAVSCQYLSHLTYHFTLAQKIGKQWNSMHSIVEDHWGHWSSPCRGYLLTCKAHQSGPIWPEMTNKVSPLVLTWTVTRKGP